MTAFDPTNSLSARTSSIAEGAILAMAGKARELKAAGADVISLTIGEPDFDTPELIRQAATDAMNAGQTHYVPVAGIAQLRTAIAAKLAQENAIPAAAENVVLANGAKQAITNTCFATLDEGDEVILLAPFWNAYQGIVEMAGGTPVVVTGGPQDGFKAPLARIAEAMSERTKLIMLNSPSNPSGAVWTREELDALANLVKGHPRCLVMSDEIYEYIWFEAPPVSMASLPGMFERTITINGVSKGFAMTGWRVGYAAAPEPVARAIAKVQGTIHRRRKRVCPGRRAGSHYRPARRGRKDALQLQAPPRPGNCHAERYHRRGGNRPASDLLRAGRHIGPAGPQRRQQAHRDRYRVLPLAAGRVPCGHRAGLCLRCTGLHPPVGCRARQRYHQGPGTPCPRRQRACLTPPDNTPTPHKHNPPAPGPWRERVVGGLGRE
jgi:histidinol-phosphate/aromatic aminotransferase/cobyric acid decarboxylase-like protein